MMQTLYTCYLGTIERFGEYILTRSVSVTCMAVPEINMREEGELVAGFKLRSYFFAKLTHPVLHTSGQTLLKCITKQTLITIYDVVQEL